MPNESGLPEFWESPVRVPTGFPREPDGAECWGWVLVFGTTINWKEGSGPERVTQELRGQVAEIPPGAQTCHCGDTLWVPLSHGFTRAHVLSGRLHAK